MVTLRQEVFGRFEGPTIGEQRAMALQARFEIECLQFDDTFAANQPEQGYPLNDIQRSRKRDFSNMQLKVLRSEAATWGVSYQELRHARETMHKLGREGLEKLYQRFKETIE